MKKLTVVQRIRRADKRKFALAAFAVLMLGAASWWGMHETTFDPRRIAATVDMSPDQTESQELTLGSAEEEAIAFIAGNVNAASIRPAWMPGDTVTLCQRNTANCALYKYLPYNTAGWAWAYNTTSKSRPPEDWLKKLLRWLLGDGSAYSPDYAGVVGGGGGSVIVTGHWVAGTVTAPWGSWTTWVFVIDSVSANYTNVKL